MLRTKSCAFLATALLTAQAGWAEEVRVYNWSDYIDEELLTQFEEETGYELIYDVFDIDVGNATWMALIWFMIFMAFPFFNKDALRAGDVIAGTWVVEAPRTKLAGAMTTHGAAVTSSSDVTGARYEFGEEELAVYGEHELQVLERMLREAQPEALSAVHATICNKIGWHPGAGDERAFLEAFYAQLRAKLEGDMRFGVRKADKFS